MSTDFSKLLAEEEARRERIWPAAERWRVIMETIAWADAQQPVPRNSKESCLKRQAELLARMAAAEKRRSEATSDSAGE